jgi:hypothetical protein
MRIAPFEGRAALKRVSGMPFSRIAGNVNGEEFLIAEGVQSSNLSAPNSASHLCG